MPKKLPYRILGVSAGNGIMLFPLRDYVIANIECRSDYYSGGKPLQWGLNFDVPMYKTIPENLQDRVDIIIGHPKCGHSSMFALSRGKQFTSHKGEPSLDLYIKSIIKYNPKMFFMENLDGLLNTYSELDLRDMFPDHKLIFISGSVTMFGNSQKTRKRLLIIGIRFDIYTTSAERIFRRFKPFEPLTTEELLINLPTNGNIREDLDEVITMYSGYKISLSDAQEFWLDNPDKRHWPVDNGRMKTAPGVYINRSNDIPLTVRKTNRQFNPKGEQMSPRELARIQGVTDNFMFYNYPNDKTTINKGRVTVGNSPPMEIGMWILSRLKKFYRKNRA